MCFHWKSLLRQIRINGKVSLVSDQVADEYYSSRAYESRIGAWASKQSEELNSREQLLKNLYKITKKNIATNQMYQDQVTGLDGFYLQIVLNFG